MIFFSNAFNALEQLVTHKMRSLLTILAIVIAVTATITVVSVVQGFTRYVSNFLEGLGTNAVFVAPQRPAGEAGKSLGRVELDEKDFRAIESQCSALRRVSPLIPRQNVETALRPRRDHRQHRGRGAVVSHGAEFPGRRGASFCRGGCGTGTAGLRGGTRDPAEVRSGRGHCRRQPAARRTPLPRDWDPGQQGQFLRAESG